MKITYYVTKTMFGGRFERDEEDLARQMAGILAALKRNFPRDDVSVESTDEKEDRTDVSFPEEKHGDRKHRTLTAFMERKVDDIVCKELERQLDSICKRK